MPAGSRRVVLTLASIVTLLGATAIMISPVTPWTLGLALAGLLLVVPGGTVLVVWLFRHW
jgi:hypothetical protein